MLKEAKNEVKQDDEPVTWMDFSTVGASYAGILEQVKDSNKYKYKEKVNGVDTEKPSPIYTFRSEEGLKLIVIATTDLRNKLKPVPVGSYVEMTFLGKKPSKVGQPFKEFKVMVDEEGKFPVAEEVVK